MLATEIIAAKRDGKALSEDQIRWFLRRYTSGSLPDYQAAALLMAIVLRGMTEEELVIWTDGMLHSGIVLDLSDIRGRKIDKHSTGGVGDKISLILAPLVAAAGVPVPMISGRGLGHTGGTLDKLESIPGFRTDLSVATFRRLVAERGCGLIGQTGEIAPADRKLYALRDSTATVESIPLIASSIMSKKLAEGIDGLVLDVKVGSGAFMKDRDSAAALASTMIALGEASGCDVRALLTDMDQPLGYAVGNSLEVIESIEVLRGQGPADVRELTLALGAEMILLAGAASDEDAAQARLTGLLDDGSALAKFGEIIEAQGGDARVVDDVEILPSAPLKEPVRAPRTGWISAMACDEIGRAALVLGAGRREKSDAIDPAVGVVLEAKVGDRVERGETIATLHAREQTDVAESEERLLAALTISDEEPPTRPLVIDRF